MLPEISIPGFTGLSENINFQIFINLLKKKKKIVQRGDSHLKSRASTY